MSHAGAMILATTLAATGNREEREMISAMSDMFIDDDPDGRPTKRAGKHCDAYGEWLDSSDTHCPKLR